MIGLPTPATYLPMRGRGPAAGCADQRRSRRVADKAHRSKIRSRTDSAKISLAFIWGGCFHAPLRPERFHRIGDTGWRRPSGRSAAWQRVWFGTKRSRVRIPPPRPVFARSAAESEGDRINTLDGGNPGCRSRCRDRPLSHHAPCRLLPAAKQHAAGALIPGLRPGSRSCGLRPPHYVPHSPSGDGGTPPNGGSRKSARNLLFFSLKQAAH
jgi:hypothetical protein